MKRKTIAVIISVILVLISGLGVFFAFFSSPEIDRSHLFLKGKAVGNLDELTGKKTLNVVFINGGDISFERKEILNARAVISQKAEDICLLAEKEGVELELKMNYQIASLKEDIGVGRVSEELLSKAFEQVSIGALVSENKIKITDPVVFVSPARGRGYSVSSADETRAEYSVIYKGSEDEILWVLLENFGAFDLSYSDKAVELSNEYWKNSEIVSSNKIHELSAYLIGWRKTPSKKVLKFLSETADITEAEIEKAKSEAEFSGTSEMKTQDGLYKGEIIRGLPYGEGTLVFENGDTYVGSFAGGIIEGKGDYTYSNGARFSGNWYNGKKEGEGILVMSDGTRFEGVWVKDILEGEGKAFFSDGSRYEGEFKKGNIEGKGILYEKDGSRYEGSFKNNYRDGSGTEFNNIGRIVYIGEFRAGVYEGEGTLYFGDGGYYEGDFVNGKYEGSGVMVFGSSHNNKKEQSYDGMWLAGKRHGHGLTYYNDGTSVYGYWLNGVFKYPVG